MSGIRVIKRGEKAMKRSTRVAYYLSMIDTNVGVLPEIIIHIEDRFLFDV
jgi:hypothetical protein